MDKVYPDVVEPSPFRENLCRSRPDLHTKNRRPTDVCFLTFFALFFTVLFFLIGYCVYWGDINRITNGYDYCGSVCGKTLKNNSTDSDVKACYDARDKSGDGFGHYGIVLFKDNRAKKICTDNCEKHGALSFGTIILFRYCVEYIVWIVLIGVEIACIGASIALWTLWIRRNMNDEVYDTERKLWVQFGCAVAATVLTVIVGIIIICMRKKIELVVQLFKEAGKAIAALPGLLLQPLLTFLAFAATIASWVYVCLWISSSGFLTKRDTDDFFYKKDKLMLATAVLSAIGMLWMIQFIVGCQHMIVGGAVSKWYFTRDKSKLSSPIVESAYNLTRYHLGSVAKGSILSNIVDFLSMMVRFLHKEELNPDWGTADKLIIKCCLCYFSFWLAVFQFLLHYLGRPAYVLVVTESAYNLSRYHLGTVALGSFLNTIIQILKWIIYLLRKISKDQKNTTLMCIVKACLCLCDHLLRCLDWFVKVFSGNGYIITAMYGHSFFRAGKQAFASIAAHPLSFAAINSVGDFVLFLAKVLVFVVTEATALYLLKGKGVQHMPVFLALVGLFSISIAHCFITVYEMTIDTIFICFCKDSEMNDGVSKPYYMSRGLMEYVDNSKNALEIHAKKNILKNRQLQVHEIRASSFELKAKNKDNLPEKF